MQGMAVIQRSVMKTVRLDPRLRERLRRASRKASRSESDLIREAVERHCDELLGGTAEEPLADLLGVARGDGSGYSRRTSEEFTKLLQVEAQKRRRR